jgi:hypothetical protein
MNEFPEFMKRWGNKIATSHQATPGIEGYVFDGIDGSQMAFWTCTQSARSAGHAHEYDEYMVVVEGCYALIIEGQRISLGPRGRVFHPSRGASQRRGRGRHPNDTRLRRPSC